MGSFGSIVLADGFRLASFKNVVPVELLNLFSGGPIGYEVGKGAAQLLVGRYGEGAEDDDREVVVQLSNVGDVLDRLDLMGYTAALVRSLLQEAIDEKRSSLMRSRQSAAKYAPEFVRSVEQEIEMWESATPSSWFQAVGDEMRKSRADPEPPPRKRPPDLGSLNWWLGVWEMEDTVSFRSQLETIDPSEEVFLEVGDLLGGGWLEFEDLKLGYRPNLPWPRSCPPIVLTEGIFDRFVLETTLEIRLPHLAGFLRFPDFSQKPQGGAVALRQTVRAFAAAGIQQPVVAIFDNDTAAREVVNAMSENLPKNISVIHLPEIRTAADYPTIGPQGAVLMDVNGKAGSIELYLGHDALTLDGELVPVRWAGRNATLKEYQGAVQNKKAVQEAFRDKVAKARADAECMDEQDWADLDTVMTTILETIRGSATSS